MAMSELQKYFASKPYLEYGGFQVKPGEWLLETNPAYTGGNYTLYYSKTDPTKVFKVDSGSGIDNELRQYLAGYGGKYQLQSETAYKGTVPEFSLQEEAEQKYQSELTAKINAGTLSATEADRLINAGIPATQLESEKIYEKQRSDAREVVGDTNKYRTLNTSSDSSYTVPNGYVIGTDGNRYKLGSVEWGNFLASTPPGVPAVAYSAGQRVSGGGNTSVSSSGASRGQIGGTNANLDGLPPEMVGLFTELEGYLKRLEQNGKVLNPNVTLTPEKVAEFMAKASSEIQPFYANQLKVAKDQFLTSLGYSAAQIQNQERQLEQTYGINLRTLGEDAAERGFAQSGLRQRDERQLATDTQNTIDTNRQSLAYNAGNAARSFAGLYGTQQTPSFGLSKAPRVLAGQSSFQRELGDSPFYELSPSVYAGLKGSEQFQQEADTRTRASELEAAFNTQNQINQTRKLTI